MGNQSSSERRGAKDPALISLNDIEKGKLLGAGALCQVHKAYWIARDMDVALKTFHVPDLIPEDIHDFQREVMLTRDMQHPNIIHFLGGCSQPPDVYLIMELAPYGTVHDLIQAKMSPFPFSLRMRCLLDAAKAMEYLHSRNVIHRDLKPENLLVMSVDPDAEVVVKLADLGVAKLKESNKEAMMTQGRGTPQYMAPEIFEKDENYSFPVDVYSFGLIIWEVTTREQPYIDIKPHFKIPLKVMAGERPFIPRDCPREWADLMNACWHPDPEKRPQFKEIVKRIERAQKARIFDAQDREEATTFGNKVQIELSELEVGQQIGHGTLCKVHKALWKAKNQNVALKTFHCPDLVPEELADFKRELWLTSQLDHPNMIRFLGGNGEPPNAYLVTELVENGSLWELLHDRKKIIPWTMRMRIAYEIADGMAYLHDKSVLHRDLKSENILIAGDLRRPAERDSPMVKIADLGMSRWMRAKGNKSVLTMGRGTSQWMAPEILEGRRDYSFPIDVYSFGIILWELATREEPYDELMPKFKLCYFIVEDRYRPHIPAYVPTALASLIHDCWHADPQQRPTFGKVMMLLKKMVADADNLFARMPSDDEAATHYRNWLDEEKRKKASLGTSSGSSSSIPAVKSPRVAAPGLSRATAPTPVNSSSPSLVATKEKEKLKPTKKSGSSSSGSLKEKKSKEKEKKDKKSNKEKEKKEKKSRSSSKKDTLTKKDKVEVLNF